MKRIEAAGIGLLQRGGHGVPLVLLHGVGSDALTWAPLIETLDPSVHALAWDAPGYGASAPLDAAFPTPRDYADALLRALDALGLGRVVLVGHSLGALFAAAFAVAYPSRVAAIGLLSPALGYGVKPGEALPPGVQARIDDLEREGAAVFAASRAPRLVFRPETKPDIVAGVQRAMAAVHPSGYAQAARVLGAGDLLADSPRIAAPTLVAVGAEDVVTPPANARAVHATLPHALPFAEVPDAGHALPQEAPVHIARLLGALLEGAAGV